MSPTTTGLVATLSTLFAQEQPGGEYPAKHFQEYIFWAYASVCVLLLLFSIWIVVAARRVQRRVRYLEERFREAHPDA